jgi:response regulator RpfG family c-di-GMP phosphodiesterase
MERVTPQQPEAGSTPEQRPPTVLVVDDDARVVELLQITLGGRGYRVLTAHDGEEALETVRASSPDFVVLDVRIPRRSGFEVCETLRNEPATKTLPIILISGNAATESRLQGLRAGADDYLTKPFSPRELLLKMQRILERNRDRDVLAMKTEVLEEEVRHHRDKLREIRADFQSHLNRLGTILEKIEELNRHGSLTEVLNRFVLTAVGILDFEAVALLVLEDGKLKPWVHRGLHLKDPKTLEFDPGAATVRILGGGPRAYATEDLALRPECGREVGLLSAAGLHWSIGVQVEGELRGILSVGERTDRQPLDRFDIKLLEALAMSVGTSLANAVALDRTQSAFLDTITSLLCAFEARYSWLAGHSERVRDWSMRLGHQAGMSGVKLDALGVAALMHNLGAVERHESLLRTAVVLSPAERKLRQREASEAAGRILPGGARDGIAEALRHQAEYWDGSGVPDGLKGDRIPLGARILAIANAYDALIHERPHRGRFTEKVALELIRARAGTQFDPALVEAFARCVEAAPSGAETRS